MQHQDGLDELLRSGVPVKHLGIGECVFTREESIISTVLGSCVSATFFHAPTHAAGSFHAVMPTCTEARSVKPPCHYVDSAIEALLWRFDRIGARRAELRVQLYGGGCLLRGEAAQLADARHHASLDVGARNVAVAKAELARRRLRFEEVCTRGRKGRKLLFHTATGRAWCRFVEVEAAGCRPR